MRPHNRVRPRPGHEGLGRREWSSCCVRSIEICPAALGWPQDSRVDQFEPVLTALGMMLRWAGGFFADVLLVSRWRTNMRVESITDVFVLVQGRAVQRLRSQSVRIIIIIN